MNRPWDSGLNQGQFMKALLCGAGTASSPAGLYCAKNWGTSPSPLLHESALGLNTLFVSFRGGLNLVETGVMITRYSLLFAAAACLANAFGAAAEPDLSKLPPASTRTGLSFAKDIRPILEASCFSCHTDRERKARGGLNMGTLAGIMAGGDDGDVVTPGKSAQSLLVIAAARIDPETAMPPPRRGGAGGPVTVMPQNLATQILKDADKNADQKISREELRALADVWFDRMDTNKSGSVDHERLLAGLIAALPSSPPPPAAALPPRGAPTTSAPGARPGTPARPGQPPPTAPPRGQPAAAPEPEAVPLTSEQVGLLRAWIDQGAK